MKETVNGANVRYLFLRNLKRFRNMMHKSQLDLANETELAHNFINDIENGKKFVSDDTIAKLATALKVEPFQFFLPERLWNAQGDEIFMEKFTDSLVMMVKEHCSKYKSTNNNKEPEETNEEKA